MEEKIKIRYYPSTDALYYWSLMHIVNVVEMLINKDENEYDIYDILTISEILLYMNDYNNLSKNVQEILNSIIIYKKFFNSLLGRFFSNIDDSNFIDELSNVQEDYNAQTILLRCFIKYKVLDKIKENTFARVLDSNLISIDDVIHYEDIVKKYDEIIKSRLIENKTTAELFVKKYDYLDCEKIFLPSFSKSDKEEIISNYICKADYNINYLTALFYHVDSNESYKLTVKQRIAIKKLIEQKNAEDLKNGITYDYEVIATINNDKEEIIAPRIENNKYIYAFPGKWFDNNLDYPTLFNNFISIFHYVDYDNNIANLSNIKKEGLSYRYLLKKIKTNYPTGFKFRFIETYNYISFNEYIKYLKDTHNINIEHLIEWFFNTYLSEEFKISNFNISLSTDEKIINRCKVLFPEFDSILKKYRIYVKYKKINNEILNATKEVVKIDDCPSLIKDKYLIINKNNNNIIKILDLLFSDQESISYINSTLKSSSFSELILKNKIKINDYENNKSKLCTIKYLIDKQIIYLENDIIKIDCMIYATCKYLYYNNFLRNHNNKVENEFVEKGYLIPYNKLFSPEEADYLSYYLNNSKFGNAKALSNKYRHSDTTLENEYKIYSDYLIGLRMLILIIIKINDELCEINK